MSRPGSQQVAAERAARLAIDEGFSPATAKLFVEVASRGLNWRTDREIASELKRPDGRPYNPAYLGRRRRYLVLKGYLNSRRLMPGGKLPEKAKFDRTAHGTTVKSVNWQAFRVRPPTPRGARTRERQRIRREERQERRRDERPMTPAEIIMAADAARRRIDGT
jgi:hypothetical protein